MSDHYNHTYFIFKHKTTQSSSRQVSLPDLPNEIFDPILHYAREKKGADRLIPLPSGRQFLRDKIDDIIFIETPVVEIKTSRFIGYIKNNAERYLFAQVLKPPGPDVQPELPTLVHNMTDYSTCVVRWSTLQQKTTCVAKSVSAWNSVAITGEAAYCGFYGREPQPP